MIKLISLATGRKILSEAEQKEKMEKMVELQKLLETLDIDRQDFYDGYEVRSSKEMTLEQLSEAIEDLKKEVK